MPTNTRELTADVFRRYISKYAGFYGSKPNTIIVRGCVWLRAGPALNRGEKDTGHAAVSVTHSVVKLGSGAVHATINTFRAGPFYFMLFSENRTDSK